MSWLCGLVEEIRLLKEKDNLCYGNFGYYRDVLEIILVLFLNINSVPWKNELKNSSSSKAHGGETKLFTRKLLEGEICNLTAHIHYIVINASDYLISNCSMCFDRV